MRKEAKDVQQTTPVEAFAWKRWTHHPPPGAAGGAILMNSWDGDMQMNELLQYPRVPRGEGGVGGATRAADVLTNQLQTSEGRDKR